MRLQIVGDLCPVTNQPVDWRACKQGNWAALPVEVGITDLEACGYFKSKVGKTIGCSHPKAEQSSEKTRKERKKAYEQKTRIWLKGRVKKLNRIQENLLRLDGELKRVDLRREFMMRDKEQRVKEKERLIEILDTAKKMKKQGMIYY